MSKLLSSKLFLHIAVEKPAINFLEFLKAHNIKWSLYDRGNGNTIVHVAVASERLSMVQFVLTHCDNLKNYTNDSDVTPIDLAVHQIQGISSNNRLISEVKKKRITALLEIIQYLLDQKVTITPKEKLDIFKLMNKHRFVQPDGQLAMFTQPDSDSTSDSDSDMDIKPAEAAFPHFVP